MPKPNRLTRAIAVSVCDLRNDLGTERLELLGAGELEELPILLRKAMSELVARDHRRFLRENFVRVVEVWVLRCLGGNRGGISFGRIWVAGSELRNVKARMMVG